MPRDVMPIMSDRDLARAMTDRSGGIGTGMGGPGPAKDPISEKPLWMTEVGYQQQFPWESRGELYMLGSESPRPGGNPIEKDLPGADEFLFDYSNELIEQYPSFRVPSMGADARHYTEPAQPGRFDTGNIMGRLPLDGDPEYIDGVKQTYIDYEDLVKTYPDMANINPEDLALQSVHGDNEHYFMPEHLWGQYAAIGQADDPNTPEDESIQDLIRYNTQGERPKVQWSTEDHEIMHGVGRSLMDNASLWEKDVMFEDPETGEKTNLFELIAPAILDHEGAPQHAVPEWDRELMHIAIYRLSPDPDSRMRIFRNEEYRNHRFFKDIMAMDASKEEKALRMMDRAANLVKALNEAAGKVGSSWRGSQDFMMGRDWQDYGLGSEGLYGDRLQTSERQRLAEGFEKQGIIGR